MNDDARKRRADSYRIFCEQNGGLYEVLDDLRVDAINGWLNAVDDIERREKLHAYCLALEDIRNTIKAIIASGEYDAAAMREQARIAAGQKKGFH